MTGTDHTCEGQQLAALARVHELLERRGIEYWLFGGWAVDFHVGSVTRAHDDIDIAVWAEDHDRIASLVAADGWKRASEEDEDGYQATSAVQSGSNWRFSREVKTGRPTRRCGKAGLPGPAMRSKKTLRSCAACAQGSSASVRSKPTSLRFGTTRPWLRRTAPISRLSLGFG
jgi:hypothetical protein